MPMRATTVRFADDLWDLLEAEAGSQGISAAQFVRDAAMLRLGALSAQRGDARASLTLADLAAGAVARREVPARGDASPAVVRDPTRLEALRSARILDTHAEEGYDRLTRLAMNLLNAPVAQVSLVDEDRQFFKSAYGLDEPWASARETPLSHSICQHAVDARVPLVIEDARNHPLVRDNLAISELNVVAYAGIPLITAAGDALGTLCVIDHKPRAWTREQIETLETLAAAVLAQIELRAAGVSSDQGSQAPS
ncbi:MAG: GAF domain-containing protein [Solirubrobacteraceae bacterium]